jgi:hypothetical protein
MRVKTGQSILSTMRQDMAQRYRKFKRNWGTYYAFDNVTGNSVSLKTRLRVEAERKVQAMNEAESQPQLNVQLARVYLNAANPKLGTRTWQEVMEHIVTKKSDETRRRWEVAMVKSRRPCKNGLGCGTVGYRAGRGDQPAVWPWRWRMAG